jgi:signal transduction histidine kinase
MPASGNEATAEERVQLLERRVAALQRVVQLSQVLNSTLELDWLLQFIIDAAAELLGTEAASIMLMDPNTRELRFEASTGTPRAELSPLPVPLQGSIAGAIYQSNQPLVIPDVTRDARWNSSVAKKIEFQTRSILGVPMRIKDKVVGVLEAVNKRDGTFSDTDVQTLSILADQAAVALENARLIRALQTAYEELNELDRLKGDVIAIASHELRTPLALILGYAEVLKDDVSDQAREHVDVVLRSAMHLRNLMENLANLRVLEAGEVQPDLMAHDVCWVIRSVIEQVRPLLAEKEQVLDLDLPDTPVAVLADVQQLSVALSNVVNNAVQFSPVGGRVSVAVAPRATETWITVSDSGPGIPPDQLDRIFDRFRQVEDHMTRRHGGLGIGLAIARGLLQVQGGRIWAENAAGGGSRFTLTIPLARTD